MTMPQSTSDPTREDEFFHRVHHQPKKLLNELLGVPAHIHHVAHHMANPPIERPQSEDEFRYVLQCLEIADEDAVIEEKFGYGVRTANNGDRLVVVWEAHTEYYTYQIWHIINGTHAPPNIRTDLISGLSFSIVPTWRSHHLP